MHASDTTVDPVVVPASVVQERRFVLHGVPWWTYVALRDALDQDTGPDECYTLGPLVDDGVPAIAIEVTVSSALIDKMAVYAGLGVPEVWIWKAGDFVIHRLVDGAYEPVPRSTVLPDLDVEQLARFVRPSESQTRLAKEYQRALRG